MSCPPTKTHCWVARAASGCFIESTARASRLALTVYVASAMTASRISPATRQRQPRPRVRLDAAEQAILRLGHEVDVDPLSALVRDFDGGRRRSGAAVRCRRARGGQRDEDGDGEAGRGAHSRLRGREVSRRPALRAPILSAQDGGETAHGSRRAQSTSPARPVYSRAMSVETPDVTRLLQRWSDGDSEALDALMPLVYERMRRLAHDHRRDEHASLSLNSTALVHEVYLKLVDLRVARFRDRAHFLAMASRVMRRLLLDHARARRAAKRGGGAAPLELDDALGLTDERAEALVELDEALERLAAVYARQSQMLEQRYFGGLSLEETAEALGVSLATAKRDLRFARAWLAAELGGELQA